MPGEVRRVAKRRRIVPDASVMVPAFFREQIDRSGVPFNLTQAAKPIADAIRRHEVKAFAPEVLLPEFMMGVYRKCGPRNDRGVIEPELVEQQFSDFLALPIVFVPSKQLAEEAWRLARDQGVPPPDSWYAACAVSHDAELWISHPHGDRLAERAQQAGVQVYLLTDVRFTDVTT
jgi:predicted nucleic acid-binding protein